MLEITDLPHLNATLNGATILFLAGGLYFILNGERERHRACMIAALVVSVAFLASYLTYHFNSGLAKFGGEGLIRPIYFTILIIHILVAAVITPLVPLTAYWALTEQFARHKRIARWTWPLWMFVAVSGVVVYVMAIHLYPDPAGPHVHGASAHG
jgi:putative membrane protein